MATEPAAPIKLLFVCVENSNRSQMSQAFAKILGGADVEAYSAGSKPSGIVNPKAIRAMADIGYDLSTHDSKSLDEVKQYQPFDAVVTMGCGDTCPWMPAKRYDTPTQLSLSLNCLCSSSFHLLNIMMGCRPIASHSK